MTALASFHVRTIVRGRSSVLAVIGFALAAGLVALVGLDSFRQLGFGAVGPATAGFLNLALLLPTAQALLVGALTLTADRETGLLAMVRARGVGPVGAAVAVWLAVTSVTWLALAAGFGVAALALAGAVPVEQLGTFGAVLGVTLLVSAGAAALGVLIGALVRTRLQAALVALVTWFVLAIGMDLVVVSLGVFLRAGEPALLAAIALDPISAGRVLALLLIDASGGALGTLGTYVVARIGRGAGMGLLAALLAAWATLPILLAGWSLRRRDP